MRNSPGHTDILARQHRVAILTPAERERALTRAAEVGAAQAGRELGIAPNDPRVAFESGRARRERWPCRHARRRQRGGSGGHVDRCAGGARAVSGADGVRQDARGAAGGDLDGRADRQEPDSQNTRKRVWRPTTGLFAKKQVHTVPVKDNA